MSLRAPGPAPLVRALVTPACGTSAAACEVGDALRLVAKAHVLDALHLLTRGRGVRFNELRRELRIAPNVLAMRLRDLAEAGLVARIDRDGAQLHVEYEATTRGRELLDALEPLQRWASRPSAL